MSKKTNKEPQFKITTVITDVNFVEYQRKIKLFEQEQAGKIIRSRIGVSMVPTMHGQQMGIGVMPWKYYEYECTEADFKSWMFQSTLQ